MAARLCVIIPAFKAGALLGRTLESALAQRSAAFKMIVIDDGSRASGDWMSAKCQDVLLEARASSRLASMGATLDIYGSGPHEGYLRETIARLGLQGRAALRGHTGDIRAVWADHHAICVPSHSEGTPLVLVEAMVCARPNIVTDVGGNTEWVSEPRSGFVAPAPTVAHYHAALQRAADAIDRWPAIGQAAHVESRAKIDPDPGSTVLGVLEAVAGQ